MQLLRKYIICATGLLATLAGCQDDEIYSGRERVKEGLPVEVRLNFRVEANQLMTRAVHEGDNAKLEFQLENMYVFIFDEGGNRIETTDDNGNDRSFFERGETGGVFNPDDNGAGILTFKSLTANNARIVGVANIVTATCETDYPITREQLDKVNTLNDLQNIVMTITNDEPIERGARFMMTGYAEDEDGNNKITISGEEGGVSTLSCILKLRRVDAKIEVNVTAEPAKPEWKHFSFKPGQWRVMRAPSQSLLLPAEKSNEEGDWDATGTYVDTQAREFEKLIPKDQDNEHLYAGGSFAFYLPENKKNYKKKIEAPTAYHLRDKQVKEDYENNQKPGQIVRNGAFEYANDNAAYLLLTGHLSYTDENGQEVNADTRYIVHLGYAKKTGSDTPADVNDYNTLRNGHYTYNIKVKGVNDIEVEVTESNERRPGAEGDIVYSSNEIFSLDSHYDRQLLEIKKTDITEKMTWSVKTPFSSGICTAGISQEEIPTQLKDYKWIKFAINKLYGQTEGRFVKYPGDQNYDDPDKSDDGTESPYYQTYEGGKYRNARLMDIHQLIAYLKDHKEDETLYDGDHICITAFIDENLYYVNPLTNADDLSLWKSSVEKEDRQLHIITEGAEYSADGNSSVVHSLYTFTQKAIRTVYNVDNPDLTTAWGLESVMETERLKTGNVSQGTSTDNGRSNCLKWLVGKKWTEVLSTADRYALQSDYNNAAYACLLRNRDLNGDDIIDADEIRWYLAAIDQLTDIYLGEYALDADSRLYPQSELDRIDEDGNTQIRWHYTSSTAYNSSYSYILWAEEGASRGGANISVKDNGTKNEYFSYRCVRNLGIPLDNPEQIPAELITVHSNIIDLSNMNPKALRSNFIGAGELPLHDERDADNRPYKKFEVYTQDLPTPQYERRLGGDGYYLSFTNASNWRYYQTSTNEIAVGYRIPNQRELLIMSSRMDESTWETYKIPREGIIRPEVSSKASYMCKTAFSLNGQGPYNVDVDGDPDWLGRPQGDGTPDREGFIWHASSKQFSLQNNKNEKGYIRAVRDVR